MTRYHNPLTGKTIEANNSKEAKVAMKPKPTKKEKKKED